MRNKDGVVTLGEMLCHLSIGVTCAMRLVVLGLALCLCIAAPAQTPEPAKELRLPFGLSWNDGAAGAKAKLRKAGARVTGEKPGPFSVEGLKVGEISVSDVVISFSAEGIDSVGYRLAGNSQPANEVLDVLRQKYGKSRMADGEVVWDFQSPASTLSIRRGRWCYFAYKHTARVAAKSEAEAREATRKKQAEVEEQTNRRRALARDL